MYLLCQVRAWHELDKVGKVKTMLLDALNAVFMVY